MSRTIARFKPATPFKRSKVDDLRRALVATGLVASVEVKSSRSTAGRTVDLAVQLEPAPIAHHRRRGRLWHRRGRPRRGQLAAPQLVQSRGRADRARRRRHAGAARCGVSSGATISCAATRCSTRRPRPATSTATPMRRGPCRCRAASSGRATSSGRRNGPGGSARELIATDERDAIRCDRRQGDATFFIARVPGEPRL